MAGSTEPIDRSIQEAQQFRSPDDVSAAASATRVPNSGSDAVDVEKIDRIMRGSRLAICKVMTRMGLQGTGALYEVNSHGIRTHVFITCNHVLPSCCREEVCDAQLEFFDVPAMRFIRFQKSDVQHVWTVHYLDATVVELSTGFLDRYRDATHFLQIELARLSDKVAMFQYPEGEFKFAYGVLERVTETWATYRFGTAPGSSGSPVLNWDGRAEAMHKCGESGDSQTTSPPLTERPELLRAATLLSAIVDSYLQERPALTALNLELSNARKLIAHLQKEKRKLRTDQRTLNSTARPALSNTVQPPMSTASALEGSTTAPPADELVSLGLETNGGPGAALLEDTQNTGAQNTG